MDAFQESLDRESQQEQHRFYNTLNAFGLVMAGKKWKWVTPGNDAKPVEDLGAREARILKHLAERRQRRAVA